MLEQTIFGYFGCGILRLDGRCFVDRIRRETIWRRTVEQRLFKSEHIEESRFSVIKDEEVNTNEMKKESSQGKIRLVASIKTFSLLLVAKFICKFRPKGLQMFSYSEL